MIIKPAVIIALLSITSFTVQAEGLGRLFTTPAQRALLEKLRYPPPAPPQVKHEPMVIVDHSNYQPPKPKFEHEVITQFELYPAADRESVKQPEPEVIVIPTPDIPTITVNGLVKRSGGRSTAWVNGINTNDGNFEPQYIKVNPKRIGRDHVHVEVGDIKIGDVSLKVGQSLDPKASKVTDAYEDLINTRTQ